MSHLYLIKIAAMLWLYVPILFVFVCLYLILKEIFFKKERNKVRELQDPLVANLPPLKSGSYLPPTKDYYFSHGDYVVQIVYTRIVLNRHRVLLAMFHCSVEYCSNTAVRIGSEVVWVVPIDHKDLKQNLAQILDLQPHEITNELIGEYLTPDPQHGVSPLVGRRCQVQSRLVQTAQGNHFIKVDFFNIHNKQTILGH